MTNFDESKETHETCSSAGDFTYNDFYFPLNLFLNARIRQEIGETSCVTSHDLTSLRERFEDIHPFLLANFLGPARGLTTKQAFFCFILYVTFVLLSVLHKKPTHAHTAMYNGSALSLQPDTVKQMGEPLNVCGPCSPSSLGCNMKGCGLIVSLCGMRVVSVLS